MILDALLFLQVKEGQVPPNFTLKDQNGKNVSLKQFKGKPVVVYFYPADDTPGCTKQVMSLVPICCFLVSIGHYIDFKVVNCEWH